MKKILLFALLIFTAIFILKKYSFAEDSISKEAIKPVNTEYYKEISIKPFNKVKQGQTVFIKIKSSKKLKNPVFNFKNRNYRIFKSGKNEYTGLLGINALEKPGQYKITMHDKTGYLNDKAFIKVISEKYPKQNIILTKRMSGLSATRYELNKIGKAKYLVTNKKLRSTFPYNSPADGCISSVFGLKRYYNGKFSGNYHKGVDIKATKGQPVKSIAGGKIIFAEFFRLNGGSVAVDHGQGLISIYIHLSKIDVKAGEIVKAGQKIGEVGQTGFATGPNLHWGLYVNGTPVDPMTDWIKHGKMCRESNS